MCNNRGDKPEYNWIFVHELLILYSFTSEQHALILVPLSQSQNKSPAQASVKTQTNKKTQTYINMNIFCNIHSANIQLRSLSSRLKIVADKNIL